MFLNIFFILFFLLYQLMIYQLKLYCLIYFFPDLTNRTASGMILDMPATIIEDTPNINTSDHSPVPAKGPGTEEENVSFPDTLAALVKGRKITRLEWGGKERFGFMQNKILMIRLIKNEQVEDHSWILHENDILASDWIVFD